MPLTKITRGALTADIIDSTKLADNAVDTEHLADDAVEAAELASDAVVNDSVASDADIAYSKLGTIPTFNQNTTGNAATVTTNADLTGHVTSSGNTTALGSFSVSQLSSALSDASISGNNTGDQAIGTAATRAAEDTMTDGSNLPDGAAIKAYGDANWGSGGTGTLENPFTNMLAAFTQDDGMYYFSGQDQTEELYLYTEPYMNIQMVKVGHVAQNDVIQGMNNATSWFGSSSYYSEDFHNDNGHTSFAPWDLCEALLMSSGAARCIYCFSRNSGSAGNATDGWIKYDNFTVSQLQNEIKAHIVLDTDHSGPGSSQNVGTVYHKTISGTSWASGATATIFSNGMIWGAWDSKYAFGDGGHSNARGVDSSNTSGAYFDDGSIFIG